MVGTGYVGLSNATLLAQKHTICVVDIVYEKVEMINIRKLLIQDDYIEKYLTEKLDLIATLNSKEVCVNVDYVVIVAPTNYDSEKNYFDTSVVETVIDTVMKYVLNSIMEIKSMILVGYARAIHEKIGSQGAIKKIKAKGAFAIVYEPILENESVR